MADGWTKVLTATELKARQAKVAEIDMEHATHVTEWSSFQEYPHYGRMQCRIWFRKTPFGTFQQKHEWRKPDGTQEREWCEDWIGNWSSLPKDVQSVAS